MSKTSDSIQALIALNKVKTMYYSGVVFTILKDLFNRIRDLKLKEADEKCMVCFDNNKYRLFSKCQRFILLIIKLLISECQMMPKQTIHQKSETWVKF